MMVVMFRDEEREIDHANRLVHFLKISGLSFCSFSACEPRASASLKSCSTFALFELARMTKLERLVLSINACGVPLEASTISARLLYSYTFSIRYCWNLSLICRRLAWSYFAAASLHFSAALS